MNPAEERFSARLLKRCRCVCCGQQLVDRVGVFLLVDQQTSRSTRVNFPVARGGYVVVYRELSGDFPSFPVVVLLVRGRSAIPHSHLPAGIVATMSRVVNYHSSWARQQYVELFDASGKWVSFHGEWLTTTL
ncbi:hypothetical protein F511_24147 [Dorcoceras hygrometricum]|uniref:Uncharacterized protein n=1 Tax=Dorcoceras hygrometricum TaxID=472368 RepID=A0A2Z7C1J5_9LAMI|nr:hypothetical protein F511_24147 [Dorcoceras hygrometricum]